MNPLTAILIGAAVCAATTVITVSVIFLAFGHVQNDRNGCLALSHGAECGLRWEPVL